MNDLPVYIREMKDSDKAFIACTWMDVIRFSRPKKTEDENTKMLTTWTDVKNVYSPIINALFREKPKMFRVLVDEKNEDQIYGWVCGGKYCVHFIYIKEDFRGFGFSKLLIRAVGYVHRLWTFSHWSGDCERHKKIGHIHYRPELFRRLVRGLRNNETKDSSVEDGDNDSRRIIQTVTVGG